MKETCVRVWNLTQIFCLVHCLSSWMLLPASLVTDIGHCEVWFPSPFLKKVVTGGGLTEIHDQCRKPVFPSPFRCCSSGCEFRGVCSGLGFLSLPHRKIPKEFSLQICFLLSSTNFLVHMLCICLGACVRAVAPQHTLHAGDHLRTGVFVKMKYHVQAPRDSVLYGK